MTLCVAQGVRSCKILQSWRNAGLYGTSETFAPCRVSSRRAIPWKAQDSTSVFSIDMLNRGYACQENEPGDTAHKIDATVHCTEMVFHLLLRL